MRVTILGTGAMGFRIAESLQKAGFDLTVWNRDRAKAAPLEKGGAKIAATPREAVASAEIVLCMVSDDAASKKVWLDPNDGVLASLREGALALESTTISVGWARELAAHFAKAQKSLLETPVLGSRPQVEAAQLICLVGGDEALLKRAEPVLSKIGKLTHYTGGVGTAATMKLFVNGMLAAQVATLAQMVAFAESNGIDRKRSLEIFASTTAASEGAKAAAAMITAENYQPLFTVDLVEKDMRYLTESAKANSVEVPSIVTTEKLFKETSEAGFGDEHITAVLKLFAKQSEKVGAK